jgi:hypothetical protein
MRVCTHMPLLASPSLLQSSLYNETHVQQMARRGYLQIEPLFLSVWPASGGNVSFQWNELEELERSAGLGRKCDHVSMGTQMGIKNKKSPSSSSSVCPTTWRWSGCSSLI